LTQLKLQRDLASKNSVLRDLHLLASQSSEQPPATFTSSITQAKTHLGKAGFPPIAELDLAKLLRPQATDSALEDMAKASAGFEGTSYPIALPSYGGKPFLNRTELLVSLHRFVDYVPLVIDTELVRGIYQGLTVALRKSFSLSEPTSVERCRDFLREPQEVQVERQHLRQKLDRLNQAEDELRDFWGP
jgi:hypothetical protein